MAVWLLFSICQQVHEGGLSLKVPLLIMKPLHRMETVLILESKSDRALFLIVPQHGLSLSPNHLSCNISITIWVV